MASLHHLKLDYKFKNALPSGDHINNEFCLKAKNSPRTSMESKIAIKKDENNYYLNLDKHKDCGDNESAYCESFCPEISDEDEVKSTADVNYSPSTCEHHKFQFSNTKISENNNPVYMNEKINTSKISGSSFVIEDRMKSLSLNEVRSTRSLQQTQSIRKNMSFSNEQVLQIERDNDLLLKKIMAQQKPQKPKFPPVQRKVSSSEINRKKLQKRIDEDNMILLRRLQRAKACVDNKNKTQGCRNTHL